MLAAMFISCCALRDASSVSTSAAFSTSAAAPLAMVRKMSWFTDDNFPDRKWESR